MKGIFSPDSWRKQTEPLSLVAQCGLCQLYKRCKSPYMKVSGQGKKKILIVSEYPGKTEDEKGLQFKGDAGFKLLTLCKKLGVDLRKDCWLTNALICRPIDPKTGENIPGKELSKNIDYCRPNLRKTIESLQPNVVIPMGQSAIDSIVALAWKDGEVSDVGTWVGWNMPSCKLNTWICPMYNPAYLLREKEPVIELLMLKYLKAAFSYNCKPWPNGKPDWNSKVRIIMNPEEAARDITCMAAFGKPMAFDYETTTLKPDSSHSEIICCSVSDGITSIAYPWLGKAIKATKSFLQSRVPKIGWNVKFEERWTRKKLGIAVNNWQRDGVLDSHVLNCHKGTTSLKFQSFVRLGVEDYDSVLDPYKKSVDGTANGVNRLKEVEPSVLLRYCALDSLFTVLVSRLQQKEIPE